MVADLIEELQELKNHARERHALAHERSRIAKILADFYRGPITISALQPILDLAVELNPELAKEPR